ncbi:hypothetical protein [Lysobacter capsici]|uniref:hypothetical protein n=1 Tax=Lysobacter capsici TaxID=435897 RepID=UPI00136612D2|nr:hypothetical protein [Lysobacter capsici]
MADMQEVVVDISVVRRGMKAGRQRSAGHELERVLGMQIPVLVPCDNAGRDQGEDCGKL